jgi:hypothetical protein
MTEPSAMPKSGTDGTTRPLLDSLWLPPLVLAGWLAAALLVYRPWEPVPFDAVDYSEFLPLLQREHGALEQLRSIVAYFATQGRANTLTHALIVTDWQLFGWNTAGWQATQWVLMAAAVLAAYRLYVKCAMPRMSAALAVSLLCWSSPAMYGWVRLTGEPLALLLVIAALLAAHGYQEARLWPARAFLIAVLIAAIGLTKEVLIAVAPLLVLLACTTSPSGAWVTPRASSRNLGLIALVAAAVGAIVVRAMRILEAAPANSYGSSFGTGPTTLGHAAAIVAQLWLPVQGAESGLVHPVFFPGNLLFLLLLATGSAAWLSHEFRLRTYWRDLLIGVGLPLVAVLAYLPWHKFAPFYAVPFLVGTTLIYGRALSSLMARVGSAPGFATFNWLVASVMCAFAAVRMTGSYSARRAVDAQSAAMIGRSGPSLQITVVSGTVPLQPWWGLGATLRRQASALGYPDSGGVVRDSVCATEGPDPSHAAAGPLLLIYVEPCKGLDRPTRVITRYSRYPDLLSLRLQTDSVRVEVFDPRTPRMPASRAATGGPGH